ncbi:MAG TPA: hypothetical protein VH599_03105 [Ktedonobacterales bacterium]|jgi:hypothetical protein
MSTTLEDAPETLTSSLRRRWLSWWGGTQADGVENAAEQIGPGNLAGQRSQMVSELMARGYESQGGRAVELSAERAATAAEAAAQAAQSAVGLMEHVGGWLALIASRAPQTPLTQAAQAIIPETAPEQESGGQAKGAADTLKRAAMTVGQRVSDLSNGRYGLESEPLQAETRQGKKAKKRIERRALKEAKAEQPGAGMSLFPWAVGLSLGLLIGLVGVAYWQRRRLQDLWEQTSQRMQQTTENMRQRVEASRANPQAIQSYLPSEQPDLTSLGSAASAADIDQQVNGRLESLLQ